METTSVDLLERVKEQSNHLPTLDEAYYSKYLMYKDFHFYEDRIEDLVELLAGIQHTLSNHEEKHYMLLEKRLLDAQEALIEACNTIYSERIRYNPTLKQLVQNTIVPYYLGRFQIGFSREISFLPLELRLYIYTSLLRTEASTIRQMNLMDRIALTLHKAEEKFLGDCAIFISAWLKYKLSREISGTKRPFSSLLSLELETIQQSTKLRHRILKEAEMTSDIAGQEFWYGFKGFSDLRNIHNLEVAKICLELFSSYFESSFLLIQEVKPILMDYYKMKNASKINAFLTREGLDEVTVKNRYVKAVYDTNGVQEMDDKDTEHLNRVQQEYVRQIINNRKENRYLYINPTKQSISKENILCPDEISQHEASSYLENLAHILRTKRVVLFEFDEYMLVLTTAMMNSKEWDLKILNIVIGSLGDLYSKVWLRDKRTEGDIFSLLKGLIRILKNESNVHHLGEGWPVALIFQEGSSVGKECLIFYSRSVSFPEFVGHFYVGGNLTSLNPKILEDPVKSMRNLRMYWQRIEKKSYVTRSMARKRSIWWKKIREVRKQELNS